MKHAAAVLVASAIWAGFAGGGTAWAERTADGASTAPAARTTVTDRDFAHLYDAVVSLTRQHFFDEAKLRDTDWEAHAAAAREGVVGAATVGDAVARLNALLARLETSHTAVYGPDDPRYYIILDIVGGGETQDLRARRHWGAPVSFPGIGIFTRAVGARHFVDGVLEGSPAHRAGLVYGDEIVSVDGADYRPIASFFGRIGSTSEVAYRRTRDGELAVARVQVSAINPSHAFTEATRESARIMERAGKRLGYIHVWGVHDPASLRQALARLEPRLGGAPLDGLVLDARGRVGGNLGNAHEYLTMLDAVPRSYWGSQRIFGREGSSNSNSRPAENPRLRGRTVLLVDSQTRSAGEVLTLGFKKSRFGTVVGTTTAGAVSSGRAFGLPGDVLLYIAVRGLDFDGERLEGSGVAPDVVVEQPLDYAAGADPVLDRGIDELLRLIEQR